MKLVFQKNLFIQSLCIEEDELIEQVNAILGDTTISTMDDLNTYINQEFNSCV